MTMKNIKYGMLALMAFGMLVFGACSKKLDIFPKNQMTPDKVYSSVDGYNSVLAKLYSTLAVTGNEGPAGNPDIGGGLDEGSQVAFIRGYFNAQELPTDEAIVSWNDQTIWDFHNLRWTSADPFLEGIYARPIYNITLANEYIRESAADRLSGRGISGADADAISKSRGEARFLRAFNYWVMLDLFGKSTFITEDDLPGNFMPQEIERTELFNYIESELKAIESELPAVKSSVYGRVDQGAAWALLARMYLNARVYTGTARDADALTYAKKVIDGGYALHSNYRQLFMADNNLTGKNEFIFTINNDGLRTKSYGNTTFLVLAAAGADNEDFGAKPSGWGGYRATAALAHKFPDRTGATDKRAMFTTSKFGTSDDQIRIDAIGDFNNGLHVNKWRNIRSDGKPVSDPNREFSDIDFPVFRLAEMYLIYAEAQLRGGGGTAAQALQYINALRSRAGATAINASDLTLGFVLDERARELYWEGHRRTDLIRYNLLTTATYLWPWKGGVSSGTSVDAKYNLFSIPARNRNANSNLTQNPGY